MKNERERELVKLEEKQIEAEELQKTVRTGKSRSTKSSESVPTSS